MADPGNIIIVELIAEIIAHVDLLGLVDDHLFVGQRESDHIIVEILPRFSFVLPRLLPISIVVVVIVSEASTASVASVVVASVVVASVVVATALASLTVIVAGATVATTSTSTILASASPWALTIATIVGVGALRVHSIGSLALLLLTVLLVLIYLGLEGLSEVCATFACIAALGSTSILIVVASVGASATTVVSVPTAPSTRFIAIVVAPGVIPLVSTFCLLICSAGSGLLLRLHLNLFNYINLTRFNQFKTFSSNN